MKIAAVFASLALTGCSLLGLEDIPIPRCNSSDDCEVLNARNGLGVEACERFSCIAQVGTRGDCRLGPEDFDGDRSAKCGEGTLDCDDRNAAVAPGNEEAACNGLDDDCNGVIDDSAFAGAPVTAVASFGEAQTVAFAPGSGGVSAVVWATTSGVGQAARLGNAVSGDAVRLAYAANARGSTVSMDGIRAPIFRGEAMGCIAPAVDQRACPTTGTCNGPGAESLPWLPNLPGDGHFCSGGSCDACTADTDCPANTLPRTCKTTPTAALCGSSPNAATGLSPGNCCNGQLVNSATLAVGADATACCPVLPRVCHVGTCRDACTRDADCPVMRFELGVTRPVFGSCVSGACLPPERTDLAGPSAATCNFSDAALDRSDGAAASWLVAAVSDTGCAAGQLRLGQSEQDTPMSVLALGPESRSNVYLGVDVAGDSAGCTGASRISAELGAAQPAVAVLPDVGAGDAESPAQGLVTFLARSYRDLPLCADATSHDVEALGVLFARGSAGAAASLHGTNEGIPTVLGRTRGIGRPGIAAIPARGWIVGFGSGDGSADDQLVLSVVARLDVAPDLLPPCDTTAECSGGRECIGASAGVRGECRPPCTTSADCATDALECCADAAACERVGFCSRTNRGHVPRASPVLVAVGTSLRIPAGGPGVDHVRLATGQPRGDVVDLGISWQQGCGAAARVYFVRVEIDIATGLLVRASSPIELGEGALPSIAYIADGVLVPGRAGPGGVSADVDNDGGWVVAWRANDASVVARRVSERDDLLVDATAVRLDAPDSMARPSVVHLFASDAMTQRLEYAYAEAGSGAVVREGALSCRAQ